MQILVGSRCHENPSLSTGCDDAADPGELEPERGGDCGEGEHDAGEQQSETDLTERSEPRPDDGDL